MWRTDKQGTGQSLLVKLWKGESNGGRNECIHLTALSVDDRNTSFFMSRRSLSD
jgi:hypothetical protein